MTMTIPYGYSVGSTGLFSDANALYLLLLAAILFSLFASWRVNSTFRKYDRVSSGGITGAQAARRVLDANGLTHVGVVPTSGKLTDHFDPRSGTVYLSESTYSSAGIAAVGVACHEVGHAIQHAKHYAPVKIRTAIVPVTNAVSRVAPFLVLIGLLLCSLSRVFLTVAYVGIIGYAAACFFQLVTLFAEFDASKRAMASIRKEHLLPSGEESGARKVLTAAAMTYVAALAVSFLQLLRIIAIVAGSSGKRRK